MPKAYSCDLRERVIEAVEIGASRREAAEDFEVSVSLGGQVAAALAREQKRRAEAARRKRFSAGEVRHRDIGSGCRTAGPDLGGDRCRAAQAADSRPAAARSGVFSTDTTSPSKKSLQAAERQRADVARARRRWIREQGMLDPARLVFIDETAVSTNMVRLRGRAPRGVRLIGIVPLGTWETITFVAALRHNKMIAPMVVEGAMTGEMFLAYVEQCLVPTLKRNDIVVMDNCRVHLVPAFGRRSRKRGRHFATCRNTRPTSIRSRCPTANSRHSCARSRREPFPVSIEQFARSSHSSVRKNVPTISDMQAMLQYDRNPL